MAEEGCNGMENKIGVTNKTSVFRLSAELKNGPNSYTRCKYIIGSTFNSKSVHVEKHMEQPTTSTVYSNSNIITANA